MIDLERCSGCEPRYFHDEGVNDNASLPCGGYPYPISTAELGAGKFRETWNKKYETKHLLLVSYADV